MILYDLVRQYHCPRWEELPNVPLYMDQVVMVISEALNLFGAGTEPAVTAAMINNYVKNKVIAPPVKKRYGKEHLAQLIVLGLFKRVFSIGEIGSVITMMAGAYGIEAAYNMFCEELEAFAAIAFSPQTEIRLNREDDDARTLLRTMLVALLGKMLVQNAIEAKG